MSKGHETEPCAFLPSPTHRPHTSLVPCSARGLQCRPVLLCSEWTPHCSQPHLTPGFGRHGQGVLLGAHCSLLSPGWLAGSHAPLSALTTSWFPPLGGHWVFGHPLRWERGAAGPPFPLSSSRLPTCRDSPPRFPGSSVWRSRGRRCPPRLRIGLSITRTPETKMTNPTPLHVGMQTGGSRSSNGGLSLLLPGGAPPFPPPCGLRRTGCASPASASASALPAFSKDQSTVWEPCSPQVVLERSPVFAAPFVPFSFLNKWC